jgi:hypothetical protein
MLLGLNWKFLFQLSGVHVKIALGFQLETVPKKKLQHEFRGLGFSTSMKSWVCEFWVSGFRVFLQA